MIIVLNQLDCAKLALTGSGVAFVRQSAVLAVSRDRVIGGLAHAEDVKTAFGETLAQYVTVHARIRHVIMRRAIATRAKMVIGDKLVPVSAVIHAKRVE